MPGPGLWEVHRQLEGWWVAETIEATAAATLLKWGERKQISCAACHTASKGASANTGITQLNVFATLGADFTHTPAATPERSAPGQDRQSRLAADGVSQTSHGQEALLRMHVEMCTRLSWRQAE